MRRSIAKCVGEEFPLVLLVLMINAASGTWWYYWIAADAWHDKAMAGIAAPLRYKEWFQAKRRKELEQQIEHEKARRR